MKKMAFCIIAALLMFAGLYLPEMSAADDQQEIEIVVTPTFGQTDARSMLDMINAFRAGDEAVYWNKTNTAMIPSKGEPLTYSYALEEIAMQRAAEIALSFSHTRPDNTRCFTAKASDGSQSLGENIAAGSSTASGAFKQWREDDEDYSGQGHRRNMLNQNFSAVGIGHVTLNGVHYWVQEFGYDTGSVSQTAPEDAEQSVALKVSPARLISAGSLTVNPKSVTVQAGSRAAIPTVSASVQLADAWPNRETIVEIKPVWTSGDMSACTVKGQEVIGVAEGSATLTGAAFGKSVSVSVTVSPGSGGGNEPLPNHDAYAILYEDGTLVFQYGDMTDGRTVKEKYPVDLNAFYAWNRRTESGNTPWYNEHNSIRVVNFADKISPVSTVCWFYDCFNLERIENIQNLDTANVVDMNHMFSGCSALTILDVSHFDTAKVTDMGAMFEDCKNLSALDVSHFDTAKVTGVHIAEMLCKSTDDGVCTSQGMSNMFYGCSSLTALDVSHFNTANVMDMSFMFAGCSSLTELDVSHFNTAKVTSMSYMFYDCRGLTELDVSKWNTANVTYMDVMFSGCSALKALDVSHFNTAKVTNMDVMFSGCSALKALDISNFNTSSVATMSSMFFGCISLTTLDVSQWNTANVLNMNTMFAGCRNLTALDVSQWNTANVTVMTSMFNGCSGLTALDVSQWNTANVTVMTSMFNGCSALTALDVSHFDTANAVYMLKVFRDCSGLTTLDVSQWNTANVKYMDSMFEGCSNLKTIYASNKFTTVSVTDSEDMFTGCMSLVGGNQTTCDESHTDKEYARIDTASAPGYFTYKAPSAPVAYAITAAAPDNGKLSVTLTNPAAATLAVSYFDANGKFVSASLQSVGVNAGTVTLDLSAGAATARVTLLGDASRPLCAASPVTL